MSRYIRDGLMNETLIFDKEIEKLYCRLEEYMMKNKQDSIRIKVFSSLLMWLERDYLPKLEQEMFGYSEITQFMLYTESQWEDLLFNAEGLRGIMFNLKKQDLFLEKMSRFVEGAL